MGVETIRLWTMPEEVWNQSRLFSRELGWPTLRGVGTQRSCAVVLSLSEPVADGAP
jgi:hypothetical protein